MISFDEALTIALNATFQTGSEAVLLEQCLGRVLAEDLVSDIDMPPFDKSAVDGFACRMEDIAKELKVIETVAAGQSPQKTVGSGECVRIMTGAPIPKGADCVVMVEHSIEEVRDIVRFDLSHTAPNICYRGEDVKKGDHLISAGTRINPGHIAIMAAAGSAKPLVAKLPTIGILSTGDELVEPAQTPSPSQIRNSNAYQLLAQSAKLGIKADYLGIARDSEEATLKMLTDALDSHDVVLLTGGVSMGDFDFVPAMMQQAGLDIKFRKIAIQPGKPTVLASKENKICFGLPGNPVSSFVLFELLVKPVLFQMQGCAYVPQTLRLPLYSDFKRRRAERLNVVPVTIKDGQFAAFVDYHGSAHIHAMSFASGFILVPEGITEIKKGSLVDVRPL